MPRVTKQLPPNRADYTFGDLLYFHLFRQGSRARGIHSPWEIENICTLTGVSERVLRNWIAGQNLPNNFPSHLADELFGATPEAHADRAELLLKFEEGWARRRESRATPQFVVTPQSDPKTPPNPPQTPDELGKPVEILPVQSELPTTVSEPPSIDAPEIIPHATETTDPAQSAKPRRRALRTTALAVGLLVLALGGAVVLWPEPRPVPVALPPKPFTERLVLREPTTVPTPLGGPRVTPPSKELFFNPAPAVEPAPLAGTASPSPAPLPATSPNPATASQAQPPATVVAPAQRGQFEGVWRVTTQPNNTPQCPNRGREMNVTISALGLVTAMCVWNEAQKTCTVPPPWSNPRGSVDDRGLFEFTYFVVPNERSRGHENKLRGTIKGATGRGTYSQWRDGEGTICQDGNFTVQRLG